MTKLQSNTRNQAPEILSIFSSPEGQATFERSLLGFVDPTVGLFCRWGAVHGSRTKAWFQEAFTEFELEAMLGFHAAFKAESDEMPRRPLLITDCFKGIHGRRITQAAALSLDAFPVSYHRL